MRLNFLSTLSKQCWNWLTTSTRPPKKGHPDLYPLDVANLTKELRLLEEGKRLGNAGLPSHDATALSGPEAGIIQRVEKARQDYVDWAVLRLNVLSQDLGRRNVTQFVNRAREADKEFERKASGLLSEQEGLLRSLGEKVRRRKAELESFQTKHGLAREANYPSSAGLYLRYAILLLLIVVEGIFNAGFFAQGLSTGRHRSRAVGHQRQSRQHAGLPSARCDLQSGARLRHRRLLPRRQPHRWLR